MPSEQNALEPHLWSTRKTFGIRLADTLEGRNAASLLVERMYQWRGYNTSALNSKPHTITLTATDKGNVVGTVTVGFDSPSGLLADEGFSDVLNKMREGNEKLCEFTKLAVEPSDDSKIILANLYHLAFIYARDLFNCTRIVIEINPRHRRFYERILGFTTVANVRVSERVNAPGLLLSIGCKEIEEKVRASLLDPAGQIGGHDFYRYFYSPKEEEGISRRLLMSESDVTSRSSIECTEHHYRCPDTTSILVTDADGVQKSDSQGKRCQ